MVVLHELIRKVVLLSLLKGGVAMQFRDPTRPQPYNPRPTLDPTLWVARGRQGWLYGSAVCSRRATTKMGEVERPGSTNQKMVLQEYLQGGVAIPRPKPLLDPSPNPQPNPLGSSRSAGVVTRLHCVFRWRYCVFRWRYNKSPVGRKARFDHSRATVLHHCSDVALILCS